MLKSHLIGRRAVAAVATAAMLSTTTAVTTTFAPVAFAQTATATASVTGEAPRGLPAGNGAGTASVAASVAPGGLLTVNGAGFDERPADTGFIAFKINDGSIAFPSDQAGADASSVDGSGTAYVNSDKLGTNFSVKLRVPADLKPGDYWVRLLSGTDGGSALTKYVWFKVEGGPEVPTTPTTNPAVTATATSATAATVSVSNFAAGETVTATLGGKAVKFAQGRNQVDSVTADDKGAVDGSIAFEAGSLRAGQQAELVVKGDKSGETKTTVTGVPTFAASKVPSLGGTTTITVTNLVEGTSASSLGPEGQDFLTDVQKTAKANAEGTLTLADVVVPNNPDQWLGKQLAALLTVDGNTDTRYETGLVVTPNNDDLNSDGYNILIKEVPSGLYQTAYSAKENAIYLTRAVGRPPVKDSTLYKLDADTLEILAETTPPVQNEETGNLWAVYGVGLDDELGLVWISNTRQNTISVYSAKDLKLIKQFEAGAAYHSRDIVVDPKTNKAYVSSAAVNNGTSGIIEVFDGKTLEKIETIKLGDDFGPTMSLDMDPNTGELFTVSLTKEYAAKIDVRNGNKAVRYDVPGIERASGVAWDYERGNLHISSQTSANNVVFNVAKKQIIADIPTGGGALNSEFDPVNDLVYVTNRTGGTMTVIDAETLEIVANLPQVGALSNHVSTDGKGNVFAVNKGSEEGKNTNLVVKVSPKQSQTPPPADGGNSNQQDDSADAGSADSIGAKFGIAIAAILGLLSLIGGVVAFAAQSGLLPGSIATLLPF